MTKPDDPQDTELAALYRASAGEQPPPGLDARILAAARAAATPPRADTRVPRATAWLNRWRIPVALAATVLMTSTLTLMVRDNAVDDLAPVVPGTGTRKAVPTAPASAAPTAPVAPAAPAAARESAAPLPTAPQPASAAAERMPSAGGSAARRMERAAAAANAAGPAAGATAAAPAATLSAPAADRADRASSAERAAESAQSERIERSPEGWLAEIRALRQQGRTAEAEKSLAQFRKRYPQFPLPEDMRQP